jgi:modulator of FtsH protease HflK
MPWQNQGGGWQGGGGNRGPWGGQGPGGRGPNQGPDLEEIIRRGQNKLKSMFPGGTGAGGGKATWVAGLVGLALFWGYQCAYTVEPDELGVVMHLGKYDRTTQPGLNFILWPLETVETPRALKENILSFGGAGATDESGGLMLAGDQNIVNIEFSVLWKISDPRAYLYNVSQPEQLLRVVSESAMREYVGRNKAEDIRTRGRDDLQQGVQLLVQDVMDAYGAGIQITGVQLNKAEPPDPVMDAFAEVNRAQQDSAKFVNEASQYGFRRLGEARGAAARIREDANAYKGRAVAEAQGEAQRFTSVYEQYSQAKDVTRKRLYLEMMENVMSQSRKVLVEPGAAGSGVLPYLPLDGLTNPKPAKTEAQTDMGVQQ